MDVFILDPNRDRYVLSFTIRDSPRDFINVQCWGGEQFMAELANGYHIGDIGNGGISRLVSYP